jgi:hypothetical protein
MTLQELLARWAELEPSRCQKLEGNEIFHIAAGDDHPAWSVFLEEMGWFDYAVLQRSVQDAIVGCGGCYVIENAAPPDKRVYARIANPKTGNYASASDEEPAIALLQAYVNWLEQSKEVKS